MRKTKIICTIGPASENEATLTAMCQAGMNVARLNFSHGSHPEHKKKIDLIKQVREKLNLPIAIMLDTKGPEYRIGTFADGKVTIADGADFIFTVDDVVGDETKVSVNYKGLNKDLKPGNIVTVNNGMVNANAVLKTDLNLILYHSRLNPIGSVSYPYKGTFDGEGHVLKNAGAMLFGTTEGATIKNIGLESGRIDEDLSFAYHTGTLVGSCIDTAPTTISNCYSKVNLLSATKDAGGLVGKLYGTLSNCYYAGILRVSGVAGGLVGSSHSDSKSATIDHCYVASTQLKSSGTDTYCGALVGYMHGGSKILSCYSTETTDKLFGANNGEASQCEFRTEDEFASGSVCWALNDESESNPTWYQTLGEDAFPVLNSSRGIVIYKDNTYVNLGDNAIENITDDADRLVDVYDIRGNLIRKSVPANTSLEDLPHGIYIIDGAKVMH